MFQPSCPNYEEQPNDGDRFMEVPIAEPIYTTELGDLSPYFANATDLTIRINNQTEKSEKRVLYCIHCGHSWNSVSSQWQFNHVLSKQYSFVMGKMDEYKLLARDLRECETKMNILRYEIAQVTDNAVAKPDPCAPVIIRRKTEEIAALEKTREELKGDLAFYDDLDYETIRTKYNDYVKQARMFAENHKIYFFSPNSDILADPEEFCEFFTKRCLRFEDSVSSYINSIVVCKYNSHLETTRMRLRTEMEKLRNEMNCLLCHVPSTRHYLQTIVGSENRILEAVSAYNTCQQRIIEINNKKNRCIIS